MKKSTMVLCLVAVFLFFSGMPVGIAFQGEPVSPVKPGPPDLTVAVTFSDFDSSKTPDGIQCYFPYPYFTITNKGQSTASDFDYTIWWLRSGFVWQKYNSSNVSQTLKPGESRIIDGKGGLMGEAWCVNQTDWKPGWRIRVDTNDAVVETNEDNNDAEIIFQPPAIPKSQPPRAIQKEVTPAPVQKSQPPRAIQKEVTPAPVQKRVPMKMR